MMPLLAALLAVDPALPLPLTRLKTLSWFSSLLEYPPIKALLPIPILIALWPLVRRFFRATWEELDAEARRLRLEAPLTEYDYRRPVACFAIVAVVLTLQDWIALGARLEAAGVAFDIAPFIRFAGEPGEQGAMFFRDPAGNPIEIKGVRDFASLFAR